MRRSSFTIAIITILCIFFSGCKIKKEEPKKPLIDMNIEQPVVEDVTESHSPEKSAITSKDVVDSDAEANTTTKEKDPKNT